MSVKLSLLALVVLLAAAIFQQRSHRPTPPVGGTSAHGATWVAPGDDVAETTPPRR